MLDKLVLAVDSVAGKLTHMENHLLKLESDSAATKGSENVLIQGPADSDEPYFMDTVQVGAKPKHRQIRQVASDIDTLESESEAKTGKKKRAERKPTHTIRSITQEEAAALNKGVDNTTVERRPMPGEGTLLGDVGMLAQREIEELSDIALGGPAVTPHATQFWDVQLQMGATNQKPEEQKNLFDFLKSDQPNLGPKVDQQQTWSVSAQQSHLPMSQVEQTDNRTKQDEQWKQDP